MLAQDQYNVQARDMEELRQRYDHTYDKWTRTDIEYARATEELVVLEGKLEIMRNECANLRAEKGIWEVSVSFPLNLQYPEFMANVHGNVRCGLFRASRAAWWTTTGHCRLSGRICRI